MELREKITLDNWPFPDHKIIGKIHADTQKDEERNWEMARNNPAKSYFLSEEDLPGIHAGIGIFTMFFTGRWPIPEEWKSYGRTIVFKDVRIERSGGHQQYLASITYIKGLIYDSRDPDAEWCFSKVMLDNKGKPIMKFGKEDLSCFYRYLVFRE